MSFIIKFGQSEERDKKLVMLRKKYFHNILQFNQQSQQEKQKTDRNIKYQSNKKFSKLNYDALQSLQVEMQNKKIEKITNQQRLKLEYEKQIQDKKQKKMRERQMDKEYARMYEIKSESESERRLQDLMKIYQKVTFSVLPKRNKTQGNQIIDNPQQYREQSNLSYLNNYSKINNRLPEISHNTKIRQEAMTPKLQNSSNKSVHNLNRTPQILSSNYKL